MAKRSRRLVVDTFNQDGTLNSGGEKRRLLAAAGPRLQNLIIAALEPCCRKGELLRLQWRDVDLTRAELVIRRENAKDSETRRLPISARLLAVLKMARTDPGGGEYKPHDFVFADLGQYVDNVKKSWETTVLSAKGHTPIWRKSALSPESRATLKAINLHFHDLRHEGASRLLEAGWPLHHVQEMLGHGSIDQTSTYLNVQRGGLQESMRRLDASRCNLVANRGPVEHPSLRNGRSKSRRQATVN